jgi:hypothetical protein
VRWRELSPDEIRSGDGVSVSTGGSLFPTPHAASYSHLPHQSRNSLSGAAHPYRSQLGMYSRRSIGTAASLVYLLDPLAENLILALPM